MVRKYSLGNDANAVKAMAMFIRKHGKKELASVLDNLHKKYDFQKIQEILGVDMDEGLKILEGNRSDEANEITHVSVIYREDI